MCGIWKNFEELEASLSIDELLAILKAINKREFERRQFEAALQGADIGNNDDGDTSNIPMHNGEVDLSELVARKEREIQRHVLEEQNQGGFITDDAMEIMSLPGIEYG